MARASATLKGFKAASQYLKRVSDSLELAMEIETRDLARRLLRYAKENAPEGIKDGTSGRERRGETALSKTTQAQALRRFAPGKYEVVFAQEHAPAVNAGVAGEWGGGKRIETYGGNAYFLRLAFARILGEAPELFRRAAAKTLKSRKP